MPQTAPDKVWSRSFGTLIERRHWLGSRLYGRGRLFDRPVADFFGRYLLLGSFRDGVEGLILQVLQGFWYCFYADATIWERHQAMIKEGDLAPRRA